MPSHTTSTGQTPVTNPGTIISVDVPSEAGHGGGGGVEVVVVLVVLVVWWCGGGGVAVATVTL
ncbi:hypothetical protein EYF80_031912 [Liparis tanakae]|uniref:Uncharacterized protein n=1 Tax=Liparis tanakae TaxID=230148 RepID=A0A4Z2GX52_9TELE|nr:hypothetical protein EYF80_031912 [Liparis tanakae]